MTRIDRAGISRLVPQRGEMCLLDAVVSWDETHISCLAAAPEPTHPLARGGQVPAIAAVEYAAQATAVHGCLLDGGSTPRAGMLAKLGDVHLHADCIPGAGEALNVRAERLSLLPAGCLYAFEVSSGSYPIAGGRLMVAFTTPSTP